MMLFIARLSAGFLSFQLATSSFYPLKIGQSFQKAYSDDDIFRGFKLNGDEEDPRKDKVFNGTVKIIPFASTFDKATFIKDYNDVENSMGIGGSLSITYKMVTGTASAKYFQKTASTKNSQTIKYQLRRVAYAKMVEIDSLTPNDEVNAFANTGDLDELADKYGTKFVDQILYGAQLDLDFSFSSNDEKDIFEISAELEGEINLKAIQIAFDAQFDLNSTEVNRNFRVDITASTSGIADFSIPANPDFTEVIAAIDTFQNDYKKLVQEAKKLEQAGKLENVFTKFSPVGFSVSSIADYLPKLNKMEAAALENKMEHVADVYFSTLFLKDQLKSTRDAQNVIYTDPRDKTSWFNPYADEVDRVVKLLDEKLDECLDFQRLPMEVIIGRTKVDVDGEMVTAMVPEPNAIDRDIEDGLLGNTFLPSNVTILNTEFKNKHYIGFGLKVNDEEKHCESCLMKPWLSGKLRDDSDRVIATENTPEKLVKSAKEKIELEESEVRIYTRANDTEKKFLLNRWTETGGNYYWESFKIVDSGLRSLPFEYKAYVEDLGLQDWKSSGFVGNPSNVSKFMDGFAIRIVGEAQHSVSYAAQIEHRSDGIVTTRKFRDGEICCIRRGGNECLKAAIKAIFVTIETKQQYAPCQRSSPCLCEDSICHDETETTSHAPSTVPSLYPTTSPSTVPSVNPTSSPSLVPTNGPTRSKETRPPTPNPTCDPTPVPTPNPTPDPTPYPTPYPTPNPPTTMPIWPDSWPFPYWPKWEIDCSTLPYNFSQNYKFAIRSIYDTYIRALPGGAGTNVDLQTYMSTSEKFAIEDAGNGKHAIRSSHGTYIRARSGGAGANVDLQTFIGSEEKFYIKDAGYGRFSFRSSSNTFIRARKGGAGSNVELQTYIGSGEKFYLIRLGGGSGGDTKEIVRCLADH